jgi:hypothetical protein
VPPRKSENDAERLERLKARLVQLHAEGQRAIAKAREMRDQAETLAHKIRQKPK